MGNDLAHPGSGVQFPLAVNIGAKAQRGRAGALGNHLFQTVKSAAADEQDVGGIDLNKFLLGMLSAALRRHVGDGAFQNFQQCLLHAFTADITGNGGVFGLAGNLVDFIHIDDTALCALHIEIRCLNQAQQDVFHVLAHITGFGQSRSIGNGKGHIQHLGQCLGQQGFTHTGGTQQQHVALVQIHALFAEIDALIVVVNSHRQGDLCPVLTDDIFIQHGFDLPGFGENHGSAVLLIGGSQRVIFFFQNRAAQLDAGIADIDARTGNQPASLALGLSAERTAEILALQIIIVCHFFTNPISLWYRSLCRSGRIPVPARQS